jgi:hypothetical protein
VEQIDLVAERLKVENLIPTEVQEYFYSKKWFVRDALSCSGISRQSKQFKFR